ncbi:MAG: M36 family metallopeptidase [Verrucomicrobiaceae bacterium]|nr:M36 family metallopeptidase [Verrucomicrobiaceae bacterium]
MKTAPNRALWPLLAVLCVLIALMLWLPRGPEDSSKSTEAPKSTKRVKFTSEKPKPLPEIEVRGKHGQTDSPPENRAEAFAELKRQKPRLQAQFDEISGAPSYLQETGKFLTGKNPGKSAKQVVKDYVSQFPGLFGHDGTALDKAKLTREDVTAHNGMTTLVWQQQHGGVPLYNTIFKANVTQDGEVVTVSDHFLPDTTVAAAAEDGAADLTAAQAVSKAAAGLGDVVAAAEVVAVPGGEERQAFTAPKLSDVTARLTWFPISASEMQLSWDVVTTSLARNEMYQTIVDAESGELLYRRSLTADVSDASYRVYADAVTKQPFDSPFPFSPGHSTPSNVQPPEVPRQLLTLSAENLTASPEGWIPDGGTTTLGNNVQAHTDTNADNVPDLPRPTSPTRNFDFPVDFGQSPTTYKDALVTQLFYMNNWIHDKTYALGFTESAGNFQTNNFGKGGLGNDAVQADAQDGSGTNNANFNTPPDGSAGRMQMFLWTPADPDRDSDFDDEIIVHEYGHGVSNRLVGGGVLISALQTAGMGEGWSDFLALSLLSQPGDDVNGVHAKGGYSTYLLSGMDTNYYFGIRRYPYSPDMSKSPLTFKDIDPTQASPHTGIPLSPRYGGVSNGNPAQVHAQGETWCNMLWEMRRNLVIKHGHAVGNQLALQLVIDGMKLSPANPNFVQARDGILQADVVNNAGANLDEMWAGFAKRGLGFSATSPASSTTNGVVEAFDVPDDLFVTPNGVSSTVATRLSGPIEPSVHVYTLNNTGAVAIPWTAAKTQPWISLSATSGTLAPGASVEVHAQIQASVLNMTAGSYTDTVSFTNTLNSAVMTRQINLTVEPYTTLAASFTLDSDPLWSRNGQWAFGTTTGAVASDGSTDPTSGFTGVNVLGINLAGGYATTGVTPEYVTAGPVNLSGMTGNRVSFKRWLNASAPNFLLQTVEVSNDGTNWTTVWSNDAAIAESAWSTQTVPLGAVADNQSAVYVRWGHRITGIPTSRAGWNIDDIEFRTSSTVTTLTADAQHLSTAQGTPVSFTLTGTNTAAPAAAKIFAVTGLPNHGSITGTAPNLTYTPDAGYYGTDSLSFTVTSGGLTSSPANVVFTVGAGAPVMAVALAGGTPLPDGTSTLNFGNLMNGSGKTLRLVISNTGGGPLTLGAPTRDGVNSGEFTNSTLTATRLEPGAIALLDVTWRPLQPNTRRAALHISSNDPARTSYDIALEGFASLPAGGVMLAEDINQTQNGLLPAQGVTLGGVAYFPANTLDQGLEMWRSDGTTAGTFMVRDLTVGSIGGVTSSANGTLAVLGGAVYFSGNSGSTGGELFKTDGSSAGTVLVRDIFPGVSSSFPTLMTPAGGIMYFVATDSNGAELWKTDGTAAGTVMVKNVNGTTASSSIANLVVAGSTLYFTANDGTSGVELWKSDGTTAGTVRVKDIVVGSGGSSPANLAAIGSSVVFAANNGINGTELWVSDGTDAGTVMLADINTDAASSFPARMTAFAGKVFFTATSAIGGTELWSTDGTPGGTAEFIDIQTGPGSSSPDVLTVVGSALYFSAFDAAGREPWITDGTLAGTRMVADVVFGGMSSTPVRFTSAAGTVFFAANGDGASDLELWRTNGTPATTLRVKDIYLGATGSSLGNFMSIGSLLVFSANDGLNGQEPWVSDGTENGTFMLLDGQNGTSNAAIANLRNVNGILMFSAADGVNGQELWKSTDGTPANTVLSANINTATGASSSPANFAHIGTTLYFAASNGTGSGQFGTELYRSLTTGTGATLVRDIFSGASSSNPANLTAVGTTLYFSATDTAANGSELWISTDGTSANTTLVKNINTIANTGSSISNMVDFNGVLYFSANDGVAGQELWRSDGTDAGTVMVMDINPGTAGSSPGNMRVFGTTLYFTATTAANGTELWKTDGTTTSLVMDINVGTASGSVGNLTVVGTNLFFSASNGTGAGQHSGELWKTDGTTTVMVKDIFVGSGGSFPSNFLNFGGVLYFAANNGITTGLNGNELWKSDGTEAGTVLVADVVPGTTSSSPTLLTDAGNGTFYFTALTTAAGRELWKSDGTAGGTVFVSDILPGTGSSNPSNLTLSGNLLYFTARGPDLGLSELFSIDVRPFEDIVVQYPHGTDLVDGSSTVDFGSLPAGQTTSRIFTVKNTGTQPLTFTSLSLTGPDAARFTLPAVTLTTLNTGASTSFSISFTAATVGANTATLRVESTDPDENPFDITLTATVTDAPEIVIEQPVGTPRLDGSGTIAFAESPVGTSVMRTLTLRNNGTLALNVTGMSITGPNAAEFITTGAAVSLPAGSSTSFDVTFTPAGDGARVAWLQLYSNDADEPVYDLYLTGIGHTIFPGLPQLMKDVGNQGASSSLTSMTAYGGAVYFATTSAAAGTELWKTDGTAAGTVMVKDINPGAVSSSPQNLIVVGGVLYFSAIGSGGTDRELWRSDGTSAGTVRVKDIFPGTSASNPSNMVDFNGTLFFAAADSGANGTELWKSDGTDAGTVLVSNINTAANSSSSPANLTVVGSTLYFTANGSAASGLELWKTDGTGAGTMLVKDINPGAATSSPFLLRAVNGRLVLAATTPTEGTELWASDGTNAGTVLVTDLTPGAASTTFTNLFVHGSGSFMFFTPTSATYGTELWRTDGTTAGTMLVKDINPGTNSSSVANASITPNGLVFSASNGINGSELWISDGTDAGTYMLLEINPGSASSTPSNFRMVGSQLFFTAFSPAAGVELWRSDFTPGGTYMVQDSIPGTGSFTASSLVQLGSVAVFQGFDPLNGSELWITDGTAAGTRIVADLTLGTQGSGATTFTIHNGRLYLGAADVAGGNELWSVNGAAGSPAQLRDIFAGTGSSSPNGFTSVGSTLYFAAADGPNGRELWKTDGTPAGTVLVKNIASGIGTSNPLNLAAVGSTLYFAALDTTTVGIELWKSDGTNAGTVLVKDISPAVGTNSSPANLTDVSGTLFFSATDGVNGIELWKSDGTSAGTVMVKDINPGSVNSTPSNLRAIGSTLYFTASTAANGTELWKSDGTSAGTVLVMEIAAGVASSSPANLTVIGSTIYFSASNGLNGTELWKTDGTTTTMVKDIFAGTVSSSPANFAAIGSTLYFSAGTTLQGTELWKSDGTNAGTVLVSDILTGAASSSPQLLTNIQGTLYFTALTAQGRELWKSDGTSLGTFIVADIWPGTSSSSPSAIGAIDQTLFILATGQDIGSELFRYSIGAPEISIEQPAGTILADGLSTVSFGDASAANLGLLTFTLKNIGTQDLASISAVVSGAHSADFSVSQLPSTLAAGGSTTFTVMFNPAVLGLRTAILSIASDDSDENPFDIALGGNGVPAVVAPVFLGSGGSSGSGTGGGVVNAPNGNGTGSLGRWESLRAGAVLASNGHIAFRGHLEIGSGTQPVTMGDFQGIWRFDGTDTRLKARSGSAAPESGGALFDMLPLNPAISPNGLITFYGTLRMGTGAPPVTSADNLGLWSELGGGAVRLLLRKGDTIVSGKTFRSGWAISGSSANTVALNAKLSSGTAVIHLDVNTPSVLLTVVAEEGQNAPGGGTWVALDGNSSDPRLSANGDLGFIGWELEGGAYMQGIYSRLNSTAVGTSGATLQARMGATAPGTSGATFFAFERPTVFNGGMAFRGFLNLDGDNVGGTKGQGVWAGSFGSLAPVVRTGDTTAQIPTIPASSSITSVWSPFSNVLGSITMRVGLNDGVNETRAIMGSTGGTMRVIAKVGDAAPGLAGETFANFDHPVIGDGDQVAFTASTNTGTYGIWKQATGGGALSLVMKVGDIISTGTGNKVVAEIALPGATSDDRKFEERCMDATGRLLIHVTFSDGTTSLLLGQ